MKNLDRYARQVVLHEIGTQGQEALLASAVIVVGCGALGTHVASDNLDHRMLSACPPCQMAGTLVNHLALPDASP